MHWPYNPWRTESRNKAPNHFWWHSESDCLSQRGHAYRLDFPDDSGQVGTFLTAFAFCCWSQSNGTSLHHRHLMTAAAEQLEDYTQDTSTWETSRSVKQGAFLPVPEITIGHNYPTLFFFTEVIRNITPHWIPEQFLTVYSRNSLKKKPCARSQEPPGLGTIPYPNSIYCMTTTGATKGNHHQITPPAFQKELNMHKCMNESQF